MAADPRALSAAGAARAEAMTEQHLLEAVLALADTLGVRAHHEVDSRRSRAGLPDLILVGRRVEFWELKVENPARGRLSNEQADWIAALLAAGVTARVVRPSQLVDRTVEGWLRALSRQPRYRHDPREG